MRKKWSKTKNKTKKEERESDYGVHPLEVTRYFWFDKTFHAWNCSSFPQRLPGHTSSSQLLPIQPGRPRHRLSCEHADTVPSQYCPPAGQCMHRWRIHCPRALSQQSYRCVGRRWKNEHWARWKTILWSASFSKHAIHRLSAWIHWSEFTQKKTPIGKQLAKSLWIFSFWPCRCVLN